MIFQAFGSISSPIDKLATGYAASKSGEGLIILGNNLVKLSLVVGGLYAFVNIIMAGYVFLSSVESKEIAKGWAKIWQSMLGLLIMAGSFVLAIIFGWIIFGNPSALLAPKVYGP